MSCNTCHKTKCCCKTVITKEGLHGKQGVQGLQGIQGVAGPQGDDGPQGSIGPSNAIVVRTNVPLNYVPVNPQVVLSYTITINGDYVIWAENTVRFDPPIVGANVFFNIRKNGINQYSDFFVIPPSLADPFTKKMAFNCGFQPLIAGDVISLTIDTTVACQSNGRSLVLLKVGTLTIV